MRVTWEGRPHRGEETVLTWRTWSLGEIPREALNLTENGPEKLVEPGDRSGVGHCGDECNESAEKRLPESITELASTDKVLVPLRWVQ